MNALKLDSSGYGRSIGRPKQRWLDKYKKELRQLGIDDVSETVLDKQREREWNGKKFDCNHGPQRPIKLEKRKIKDKTTLIVLIRTHVANPT